MLENLFAEDVRGLSECGVGIADADRNEGGEIVGRSAVRAYSLSATTQSSISNLRSWRTAGEQG